ncbi:MULTISPECIES: dTDP-4-dehydrorhamnose 3,5-epimerase family protein [unclassified Crossiella]|uniref:dTDP-4-dehydrorhamnose 3,5-epimerase family protein n=1 Tax=unclassified Crossiella TaxID=2620835 RepID=UPI00200051E7|nr:MULTISPECIES: dTDP-4-dehydrorhamnose 3,5-epimerase [unclassified Crossiella]MCK2243937.1 dTDP-4-dehydrorhamnose 3,5-epimerase [Crossiella sp. S99.2]MCK2257205.1 dTDP-4-dehydrorhamnose 3,5-epimerase [Crossiella sp. S99.1]
MQVRKMTIPDAYEFTPKSFPDDRGLLVVPFQADLVTETVGYPLPLAQSNHSVSRRGVIRGVHFADTPPGQAKYVYCASGALLDIIIDIRLGSPTFGKWEAVRLSSETYNSIYISEGLGHCFLALEENTVMSYLCSTPFTPARERAINPLDPALGLPWAEHLDGAAPVLSVKDTEAPSLAEAEAAGLLPKYQACVDHYASLRANA